MKNVRLINSFSLNEHGNHYGVYSLKLHNSWNSPFVAVQQFLDLLPITAKEVSRRKTHLNGQGWSSDNFYGFVSDGKRDVFTYLAELEYDHYQKLENDIKRWIPSYVISKKSGRNLTRYIEFFKDALLDVTVEDVTKHLCHFEAPISIADFASTFHLVSDSHYVLPLKNVESFKKVCPQFNSFFDTTPGYILQHSISRRSMTLFYNNESFFMVMFKEATISFNKCPRSDIEKATEIVESFFPSVSSDSKSYGNYISASSISEGDHWRFLVPTDALKVSSDLSLPEDYTSWKEFFLKTYGIKGRGRDSLWEKGEELILDSLPTLEHPLLEKMCNSGCKKIEESMSNRSILHALHSPSRFERMDVLMKVRLMTDRGVVEKRNPHKTSTSHFSDTSSNQELYMMRDYGELSRKAPSFDELLDSI